MWSTAILFNEYKYFFLPQGVTRSERDVAHSALSNDEVKNE